MKMQTLSYKCSEFFYDLFDDKSSVYKKHTKVLNHIAGIPLIIGALAGVVYHLIH